MKICYINFKLDNPRDQITLRGLRENGAEVVEISDRAPGWGKYVRITRAFHEKGRDADVLVVGYAGSLLVPALYLFTGKRAVYNALGSFIDSMIISRRRGALISPASVWYYLIDFLAFHVASHLCVESHAQKNTIARKFFVRERKISVIPVGADDREFYFDPSVTKCTTFTAVFRGAFLPEAGADVVVRAAKELESEGISVRVIGRGLLLPEIERLVNELRPTNLEFITEKLPIGELRQKMLECHVSLGQMAKHPRLHTTIPHKAFESMSMKLPYVTGRNRAVLEVLEDGNTCFAVPAGDYQALAKKLIELRDNAGMREVVAERAHELYEREFTAAALARKLLAVV